VVGGLLLRGGSSLRMGRDKAELVVAGERLADHAARVSTEQGERAMHALLSAVPVVEIAETEWRAVAPAEALVDLDTPEDLAHHGIDPGSVRR
jgi:molybdopterin-guanine dinucleotide biosynthesis protein A